jgi:hypothetical protein
MSMLLYFCLLCMYVCVCVCVCVVYVCVCVCVFLFLCVDASLCARWHGQPNHSLPVEFTHVAFSYVHLLRVELSFMPSSPGKIKCFSLSRVCVCVCVCVCSVRVCN